MTLWSLSCACVLLALCSAFGQTHVIEHCMDALKSTYTSKYDKCVQLLVTLNPTLSEEAVTVTALLAHLPDHVTSNVSIIVFEYGLSVPVLTAGRMADAYLQARPYFTIYEEEHPWQTTRTGRLVLVRVQRLSKALQHMAEVLTRMAPISLLWVLSHSYMS